MAMTRLEKKLLLRTANYMAWKDRDTILLMQEVANELTTPFTSDMAGTAQPIANPAFNEGLNHIPEFPPLNREKSRGKQQENEVRCLVSHIVDMIFGEMRTKSPSYRVYRELEDKIFKVVNDGYTINKT